MNFFETNNQVSLYIVFLTCITVFLKASDFVKFIFAIYDQKIIFLNFIFPFFYFKVKL